MRYFILILSLLSCKNDPAAEPELIDRTYKIPEKVTGDWDTAHLNDVDISLNPILDLLKNEGLDTLNFHSLLIVKNNKLVLEKYWPGYRSSGKNLVKYDRDELHELHSVTKSITSILYGIAIEKGYFSSEDDLIKDYLPVYSEQFKDIKKSGITIKDMLTMRAGLNWDEWSLPYSDIRNSHVAMNNSHDPLHYLFSRSMKYDPGLAFVYNSGLTIALGKIIENRTEQNLLSFSQNELFKPLGIHKSFWHKLRSDLYQSGGGLMLRPRDMAKIGQLILNNGSWKNKVLINESYLKRSIKALVFFPANWVEDNYAYFWWGKNFNINGKMIKTIHATGYGGQHIYIVPAYNMIVVFTAGNYKSIELSNKPNFYMDKFILRAAIK